MPIYTTPTFNVSTSVWTPGHSPATHVADFTNVMCQVYVYSRTPPLMYHNGSGRWLPQILIRIPFSFPINVLPDTIFRPSGSSPQGFDNYKVQYKIRLHSGFSNQYHSLYCLQCNDNGTIPRTPLPT